MSVLTAISIQPTDPLIPLTQSAKSESFGTCLEKIFTAFWDAIKKFIADIQAFFQNLMGNDTLKSKTLQVEQPSQAQLKGLSQNANCEENPTQSKTNSASYFGVIAEVPCEEVASVPTSVSQVKEKAQALLEKMDNSIKPSIAEPVELTAYQREHRVRKGAADIQDRLDREWQHAQNQMAREKNGKFVYKVAPKDFAAQMKEERIGNYEMGLCHFKGARRKKMEDEHLAKVFNLSIGALNYTVPLFAIMDGHGGNRCAGFVRDNLQQTLNETLQEFNPQGLTDEGIWNALKHTGVRLHERFLAENLGTSGTTLVFSMILDGKLWTANVGDSRAVLDDNGVPWRLSEDAKPANPSNSDPEISRYNNGIIHRDGMIKWHHGWRIYGELSCARSIGDSNYEGANSARAKITMRPLKSLNPNSHLILGCDGIFDVSSSKEIVEAVNQNRTLTLGQLAKNIINTTETCGSLDNQSIMIVRLT